MLITSVLTHCSQLGTGIFQPADVGIQRILKHFLRQKALDFLVKSHQEQLAQGLTAEQIRFTTSLLVLRNASVQPILELHNFLSNPIGTDIIKLVCFSFRVKQMLLIKLHQLGMGEVFCKGVESRKRLPMGCPHSSCMPTVYQNG